MATSSLNGVGNADYFESSGNSGGSVTDQIDLQHYLRILRKYKWLIVLFTALVTCAAGYYAYTATPIYQSTSTLLIESQRNNVVSVEELVGFETENTDYYQTQFELLKSRELAGRVIGSLGLMDHPEFAPGAARSAAANANSSDAGQTLAGDSEESGAGSANPLSGFLAKAKSQFNSLVERSPLGSSAENSATGVNGENGESSSPVQVAAAPATTLSDEERERRVISKFKRRLTITPVRNTKLVKISFESADPELAATIANSVGEQYILAYLDAKLETTVQLSSWLNGQIDTLKGRLEDSEQRLIEYKRVNGLFA